MADQENATLEGRVIRAINGFFYVDSKSHIRACRARGIFRKRGINVLVGDKVMFEPIGSQEGILTEVLPRRTELVRPPIANLDQALLVFSLVTPDFQPGLLDRMLVTVARSGLSAVIVLTKSDLASDDTAHRAAHPYEQEGYRVVFLSMMEERGLSEIYEAIQGRVTVLAGPSGVGKSTLANTLSPELGLKMGEVSEKIGRGRHTTRHVELFRVAEETWIADAPGFSQLDLDLPSNELRDYFPGMVHLADLCEYRMCMHVEEDGCAVKAAVDSGGLSKMRYQSYCSLYKELKEREERMY